MLDATAAALSFVEDRQREDLDQDQMLLFALVCAVEVIGEAASKVARICVPRYQLFSGDQLVHPEQPEDQPSMRVSSQIGVARSAGS